MILECILEILGCPKGKCINIRECNAEKIKLYIRRRETDMEKCNTLVFANFAFERLILDRVLQFVPDIYYLQAAALLRATTTKNIKQYFNLYVI